MFANSLTFAIAFCVTSTAAHGALYRWVDDKGQVQYSDTPPGKEKGAVQLSNRGLVLKKLEGPLTAEEQKTRETDEARKRADDAKAVEQRRQDSALLQSFTTVQEIDMKRDREIQALEIGIANLREQERLIGARLAEDRRRSELFDKSKKPVPDAIKEDIVRGEAERKTIEEEIKRRYDDIGTTRAKYEALKKRYIALRQDASPIQPTSAAAPAAAAKK